MTGWRSHKIEYSLELRHCKNDSMEWKKILCFEIAALFCSPIWREKSTSNRSYIIIDLDGHMKTWGPFDNASFVTFCFEIVQNIEPYILSHVYRVSQKDRYNRNPLFTCGNEKLLFFFKWNILSLHTGPDWNGLVQKLFFGFFYYKETSYGQKCNIQVYYWVFLGSF